MTLVVMKPGGIYPQAWRKIAIQAENTILQKAWKNSNWTASNYIIQIEQNVPKQWSHTKVAAIA